MGISLSYGLHISIYVITYFISILLYFLTRGIMELIEYIESIEE